MSDLVLPKFPHFTVDPERAPTYRTQVYEAPSGSEQRVSRYVKSRPGFRIRWSALRDDVAAPAPFDAYSEIGALLFFHDMHLGARDSFYFDDPLTRKNLLTYSQALATSPWYTSGGITNNVIVAPDGTTTGTRIVGTVADSYVAQAGLFLSAGAAVLSLWAKATSSRTVNFHLIRNNPWTILGQINAALTTAWQRFQCSGTAPGDECIAYLGGETTIGVGVEVHLWGAQVEPSSSARLYVPTGATPITGRVRVRFKGDQLPHVQVAPGIWRAEASLVVTDS